MQRILIHPPFADPTQPYLSLPTLKGWLRQQRLDARVLDLNVEAIHWLLRPDVLRALGESMGSRFLALNARRKLDPDEEREYAAIVAARAAMERLLAADPTPIEVMQQRKLFFDADRYGTARRQIDGLFTALSAVHFPLRFGFNHVSRNGAPWSFADLARYCDEQQSPLRGLYREVFEEPASWDDFESQRVRVDLDDVDFAGVSVVFPSQIPEALFLCRLLKQRAPHAFVALGGPCIHQIAVHQDEERRRRLLAFADGIALFEGEATVAELFPRLEEWRAAREPHARAEVLAAVPNLLLWDDAAQKSRLGPPFQLDLREVPAPDYSDLDLDRYLAPSRTLLYAPTRGCYWGKCSFCYYGLAETATAAYREVPAERAAADLARLAQRHGVRNFYISCDVLSPKYAVQLAEALLARGLNIRWSSDLKIEKYFTPERCALLYRSGLRSAAFGIESGSDRILDLMRKGSDRATMTAVSRAFWEAGVATEWMTFTGHPTETVDEALATAEWIEQERSRIALFFVGEFGLEQGSHIAQDPKRYGVEEVFFAPGDDLRLYASFRQRQGPRSEEQEARIEHAIGNAARGFAMRPYPWAGAISTHHSFLYFAEHGPNACKDKDRSGDEQALPAPPPSHIAGLRQRPRFPVAVEPER
jgi:radical SAM superfamily enzyme YgiQ (UPF0313 family)